MGVEQIIQELRNATTAAQHLSEMAMSSITNHEKVCAERYTNIQNGQKLSDNKIDNMSNVLIPRIFETLSDQNKILYTGMGIFIGVPLVVGFCFGIFEVIKMVAK